MAQNLDNVKIDHKCKIEVPGEYYTIAAGDTHNGVLYLGLTDGQIVAIGKAISPCKATQSYKDFEFEPILNTSILDIKYIEQIDCMAVGSCAHGVVLFNTRDKSISNLKGHNAAVTKIQKQYPIIYSGDMMRKVIGWDARTNQSVFECEAAGEGHRSITSITMNDMDENIFYTSLFPVGCINIWDKRKLNKPIKIAEDKQYEFGINDIYCREGRLFILLTNGSIVRAHEYLSGAKLIHTGGKYAAWGNITIQNGSSFFITYNDGVVLFDDECVSSRKGATGNSILALNNTELAVFGNENIIDIYSISRDNVAYDSA